MSRLKRLSASLLLATALALSMAAPGQAGGGHGDAKGPACSDIATELGYSTTFDKITLLMELAAAPCSNVTYATVLNTADGQSVAPDKEEHSVSTVGVHQILYTWNLAAYFAQEVCAQSTTTIGGHVADYAPDVDSASPQCISPDEPNAVRYG